MPHGDPRDHITPDAFVVAPELLGLPLARPWRRAVAFGTDLLLVAVISNAPGFLLALAAAWVLWRASSRGGAGGVLRRGGRLAFRVGAAALLFVAVLSAWDRVFDRGEKPEAASDIADGTQLSGREAAAMEMEMVALRRADSPEKARSVAERAAGRMEREGIEPDQIREMLSAAVEDADSETVAAVQTATEHPAEAAADTLARLERENARLDRRVGSLERALQEAGEERNLLDFLREALDELGIGFGWSALYFTAFLVLWRGQTPGKRLLGLRVLRLDAEPIGWWCAFERFGGYLAGVFTGLLDYFLIVKDRNRQALHDKIVDTVVIRDAR